MVQIIIVDDQELIRSGLRMVLDGRDGIAVVGEAANGVDALALCASTSVDVVVMDVRMPGMDGIEATRRLQALPQPPRVLVLTTFDLDEYAYAALRAGASGFLLKDAGSAELARAVHAVHNGDAVVAPSTTRRLLDRFVPGLPGATPISSAPALDPLTPREREVLMLIARGRSNAEIAGELYLTEGTVKTHVSRILHKLGLRDRVQAVIFAYENSMVRPIS